MSVTRIIPLTLGWEDLPKSVSVHGAPSSERLREPVPGVLLETPDGWVLLDTGFNTALIRDLALRRRFYPGVDHIPILPPGDEPLLEALEQAGVELSDIHAVALSHMHCDHAGGLKHFAGKVPVHAQRRELEFALHHQPEAERDDIFRVDVDDPAHRWVLAEGDTEIAPGVRAISTPGHTPGHQSFMVTLDERVGGGGFVFAFDAADLTENIELELPVGGFIGVTAEETLEPIRRLKALAQQTGYALIPGHDPVVWPALTDELAVRFGLS